MTSYHIPARMTRKAIQVSNSRFIATAAPTFTVAEARAFIAGIRQEFADATHNVPAYIIGHGASVTAHCSDDGEPAGTAGRPLLAVLRGSGLGDTAVVVTRYFGGTKLGTGGLVRAYSDAARGLLAALPLAEKVPTVTVGVDLPYPLFERVRLLIIAHQGTILNESFAADVLIVARLKDENLAPFQFDLQELSSGALTATILEKDDATIMPLIDRGPAAPDDQG